MRISEVIYMDGKKGRVIGIISVKGGVGKTTVVSNLGASLASQFGKSVLLVDGNFSAPNLGIHLGVIEPDRTIHDVMHSNSHIKEAILGALRYCGWMRWLSFGKLWAPIVKTCRKPT